MDFLGNMTEDSIKKFIEKLDEMQDFGPSPVKDVFYDSGRVSELLSCSEEIALKLFTEPVDFHFDDCDQVYLIGADGNRYYLDSDDSSPNFTKTCDLIVNSIPEVPFDLECDGYLSRQKEASCLYKALVFNRIVEGYYDSEIRHFLSGYDYENMTSSAGEYVFTGLCQKMQEESGPIEKVILSCLTQKCVLSNLKKDTSYEEYLDSDIAERLRVILRKEANINYSYDIKFNEANSQGQKFLIGEQLVQARRDLVEEAKKDEVLFLAFKIYKLNLNSVPGRKMRQIRSEANKFIRDLNDKGLLQDAEATKEFRKKLIKRAAKLYLLRMKQIRYKLISAGERDTEILIPKS